MKIFISCSIAGLVLLTNAAYAGGGLEGFGIPSNMDFYGGASAGITKEDGACNVISGSTDCEDSSNGYKVFVGARLNPKSSTNSFIVQSNNSVAPATNNPSLPSLGLEAGYINFGESKSEADFISRGFSVGKQTASSESSGIFTTAVGYMPVAPKTEILGKAGLLYWSQDSKSDTTITGAPTDLRNQSSSQSENGLGYLLGVGAQYKVTDNLSVRGEYEQAFGVGKDNTKTEPNLLSVGAVFSTL